MTGIRNALTSLPKASDTDNTTIDDVRRAILESDATPDVKTDAVHVLDTISKRAHSTLRESEHDALCRVWARIQSMPPEPRAGAVETLALQLASAIERGHVVCSTGKIARIVGTLDGLTDDATLAPLWAVREEMMRLAASIRARHETPDDPQNAQKMIDALTREATAQYVDTLGMHPDIVRGLLEEVQLGF